MEKHAATTRETPLSVQDVRVIAGIGPSYAWSLKAIGVYTISQLAKLDSSSVKTDIPSSKLVRFQSQARLALGVKIDVEIPAPLLDFTVSEVLHKGWNGLAGFFEEGEPREQAELLSRILIIDLEHLKQALDDAFLEYCRLGDIVSLNI